MKDKEIHASKAYPNDHEIQLTINGLSMDISKEEALHLLKAEAERQTEFEMLPASIKSARNISITLSSAEREKLVNSLSKFLALNVSV